MGAVSYAWDQQLIEGPPETALVRVDANLVQAKCKVNRGSSYGAARSSEYGEPVVKYEYQYAGRSYVGERFYRQRGTPVGYMADCERLVGRLLQLSSIDAWVDPARPDFAVLSKELRSRVGVWTFLAIGCGLAMLGMKRLLTALAGRVNKGGHQ